jgi:predicted transposase YbfD/YdcC
VINKVPLISKKVTNGRDKKGGEQGAIECLLRKYHRLHPKKKLIISIDAIGANQYITKLSSELGYHFVIGIKRDELDGLAGLIKDDFITELKDPTSRLTKRIIQSPPNHGRTEKRTFYMINDTSYIKASYKNLWQGIEAIGMMKSEVMINKTLETKEPQYRYFITSVTDINTFVSVKRRHWNIESFHYILDNSFREDRCRCKRGSSAINLNLIRKFIYTIIQLSRQGNSFDEARGENKYLSPRELLYKILYVKGIKSVQ